MDGKLGKYQSFRDHINKMLFWSGIWPHLEDTSFCYNIIPYIAAVMYAAYELKVTSFCIANISKVSVFVKSLSTAFGLHTLALKMVSYLLYRKDLVVLGKELGRTFEEELENTDNRQILLQDISVYRRFLYGVSGLVTMAAILFYNVPVFRVFKYKKYEFIYEGNYPFPVAPATPLYWILLFYEASSIWWIFNITNGVDNAFGLHCFRACGLLRLAAQRWKQFRPNDPISKQQIRQCVRIHQLVIKSKDRLQRVYGYIVLWNYVTISIILCSLLWQVDQVKHDMTFARIIYFICYIMLKSLQAFTYAYYGSRVSQESENYQEAVYFSDWPGCGNIRMMKDILIIYTQRIIILKASGYFFITMEMFEKILNTTLSYFFLLQTVDSKN
ncbi:odorant receptor 33b-like [Phymastichus coffea]|uniref:odorant receptor 33b-like n=1 Tax=Phymastichus coffea TaxID=108790 RepID=UPI00273CF015|nr:odorant receptor 33b-like [Phymastichus coffea]XP_058790814.1 odorant receptor 33b-like [Phymastichus coffea]